MVKVRASEDSVIDVHVFPLYELADEGRAEGGTERAVKPITRDCYSRSSGTRNFSTMAQGR